MNNTILKSLDLIIEGLTTLKAELEKSLVAPVKEEKSNVVSIEEKKSVKKKAEKTEEVVPVESTDVDLENMKFTELKKYASEIGVKNTGTRDEIIARIKKSAPVEEPVEESAESEEEFEGAMNPPEEDEFAELAKQVAEETSVEDIISALADVNVKATKKNYLQKLEDALRTGLIELDDEDEEEEESVESESEDEEEDEEVKYYYPEFDPEGYNDPEAMSEERLSACNAVVDDILDKVTNEKLSLDEIKDFLEEVCTEDELELITDADDDMQFLYLYMEIKKRLVDEEGDVHELNDPYELGESNFCCGHELKYDKKSNMYICEVCGQEYEADEE